MTVLIIAVLGALIWIFMEIKRLKHKIFAIFLISLIIFAYISFVVVLKGRDIDYTSVTGLTEASKLYFAWIGVLFKNIKSVTTYTTKQDWSSQENSSDEK